MSEEAQVQETQPEVVEEVPNEVREMQKALSDLASYRNAVTLGSFPGAHVEATHKLRNFLKEAYEQVFNQFNAHPYVIMIKERESKK